MKLFFSGIIAGAVLAFIPVFGYNPPEFINFEWEGTLFPEIHVEPSQFISDTGVYFSAKTESEIARINSNGSLSRMTVPEGYFSSVSNDGKYYALYQKIGKTIEFYDNTGARYWQKESDQYPYLSSGGNLVALLVADHSAVYFFDKNGNKIPNSVSGRFCTQITSSVNDFTAISFLDGSFYLVDINGNTVFSGVTENNYPAKSIAASPNGNYIALHYGNTKKDFIKIINTGDKSVYSSDLPAVNPTKTALAVGDDGESAVISGNNLLVFTKKCREKQRFALQEIRTGHSSAIINESFTAFSCMNNTGSSIFILSRNSGLLFTRNYPDKALDLKLSGNIIFAKGTTNLYCMSYSQ